MPKSKKICRIIYSAFIVLCMLMITGCSVLQKEPQTKNDDHVKEKDSSMEVWIYNEKYTMTIEDNETTRAFANLLPKEFQMNELIYFYFGFLENKIFKPILFFYYIFSH